MVCLANRIFPCLGQPATFWQIIDAPFQRQAMKRFEIFSRLCDEAIDAGAVRELARRDVVTFVAVFGNQRR
jgi:hypothetical protein